ncbi:allophanate hydrolase [Alishewanella longhuensis]|uniref:Allophanate hydrolase n=1 Tax=Alishewanella longhuensis TaxID=1091037 RepID=A0ABQ3L2B0_9ALTE|nr:biotin-dependent carboxyltransferase family protein [Alishewanella longhuensis]GHG77010.1 allophanate hydrolase [Alishewanella longhuensis]
MNALRIVSPGVLSLLQDFGRFGQGSLGLTQGGPMDGHSFRWANALVGNPLNSTVIEHSVGGLILLAQSPCTLAVTGAALALSHNGQPVPCWQALHLKPGDELALGIFSGGLRAYIAVTGGIQVPPQFGSSATVMREGIGGLVRKAADNPRQHLAGQKLQANDLLPLATAAVQVTAAGSSLPTELTKRSLPGQTALTLRVIEGYQASLFSACQRARFYLNPYQVSPQSDRMGYKLNGSAIHCSTRQLLSEGISYGAIQIPPDGQPIVLLNDRQTLGGYPKIGNVLSLDCWQLAQATPGTEVHFTPVSAEQAHNALQLDAARFERETTIFCALASASQEC